MAEPLEDYHAERDAIWDRYRAEVRKAEDRRVERLQAACERWAAATGTDPATL